MFCYQCEQTYRSDDGAGCSSSKGMCGKDATTSDLQDLLIHAVKGIGQYAYRARALGAPDAEAGAFIPNAIFTTLTNVNFSNTRFVALITEAAALRDRVKARYEAAARAAGKTPEVLSGPAAFQPAADMDGMLKQAAAVGVLAGQDSASTDVIGLRNLILYGLKGVCAYTYHAQALGYEKDEVHAGLEKALDFLASDPTDIGTLLSEALALGTVNYGTMELLDAANTGVFGTPEPTSVRVTPIAGKAILVSGHEYKDLLAILEATAGTGINVYTHGEMLPGLAYPKLKAHPHLAGNYGGAWQDQQKDFADFPGPVVMTSNCMIEPQAKYRQRIFTLGPVGWPGVRHLDGKDYSAVVQAARALPGFKEDAPEQRITIGFARDAVLGVADKVVEGVKSGAIKHFFLMGGCDGAAPGRNYYTEFAEQTPQDTVMLTLGCAKYRFNKGEYGDIGGIPRLLDVGQCSDSYSAIAIASALAKAFNCGINELPLSLVISWFEQKAAAVLLTLLSLGVKNIRLGPTLPAFLTPNLIGVLVEQFGIQTINTPEADIAASLKKAA
ncbi:MAG: hydroxylamine reductase [Betaproteobacteria bacterium]